ncbi:MAG: protein-export chaperone SecB [Hyphomicrobiaceae bacterium]|nr:protein-export chaperone SecB [Hyphomicrobiaceae bacterium]
MAESKAGNGGNATPPPAGPGEQQVQVRVLAQYIKDLSFESPNVHKLFEGGAEAPNLRVEVNVGASKVSNTSFESVINFKAEATNKLGTIYDLELAYAGMFQVENLPEPAMEPFLLIDCPTLLFPFVRRLVSDLTREGGFPPLLLDPINFANLFAKRQQERAQGQAKPAG